MYFLIYNFLNHKPFASASVPLVTRYSIKKAILYKITFILISILYSLCLLIFIYAHCLGSRAKLLCFMPYVWVHERDARASGVFCIIGTTYSFFTGILIFLKTANVYSALFSFLLMLSATASFAYTSYKLAY